MSFNQKSPTFSIIMAVYNGTSTLPKTLQSLVQQDFKDFEVVVVNDESKDDSEGILKDFAEKNPEKVQYIFQKNKGLGGARNAAMRKAKGEFLSLLDQDDVWYPEKLKKTEQVFKEHPEISFATHHLYHRVNGEIVRELRCDSMLPNVYHQLLFNRCYFCGSAMSFRRSVLDKIGFFSEDRERFHMAEDYDYWLRASAMGMKFFVLPEILGEYVVHGENFSKNKLLMWRNEWNVAKSHYKQRPIRKWRDPLLLFKHRSLLLCRKMIYWMGR